MGRIRRTSAIALAAGVLVVAACSEPTPDEDATDATTTGAGTGTEVREGDTVVERFAGEDWFLGTVPDTPVAADSDTEPVVIGMINQEDTPLGSFPEIRRAVEAGVEFVNTELGGVGGRPIELHTCITSFDPEQSAACAQEMVGFDVVALVGGIDVTSNGSIPVLEENGIPQLGGIPANLVEQQSDVTFFFSGGVTGGLAAFLAHTAEEGGTSAVLAYGEFESFQVAVDDYAVPVADLLGVDTETISFPLTATDFLPVLTRAAESDPDSIIVAAAGSSCAPIMQTYRDLGIEAQLYLVGACADDEIIRAADGAEAGVIFNSEGPPVGEGDVEGQMFNGINELYADGAAGGAGTVGLRGFLDLYAVLDQLGPDDVSRESILDTVRSAVDQPSFWGHPYTCDGEQVAGLPSLCAPQQSLFDVDAPGLNVTFNEEWYDTVDLFARAG
jgi:branched-chain amino acid transport system substrate-binding protein